MPTHRKLSDADRHEAAAILRRLPELLPDTSPEVAAYLRGQADALDGGKEREAAPPKA